MKKNNPPVSRGGVVDYAVAAAEQMDLYCADHPGGPVAVRFPQLFFPGDLWIALLGPSVEEGIVGISPTVSAALRAFDAQYLAGLRPTVETTPKPGPLRRPSKAFVARRRTYGNSKSDPYDRSALSGFAWPA
jgi:hypothetical protein